MEKPIPIACTLTDVDLGDRLKAWLRLGNFLEKSEEIPRGLAIVFDAVPGVYDSLQELVRLEAECCAWMAFALEETAGKVTLRVTAAGRHGELAVREAFAPLAASGR